MAGKEHYAKIPSTVKPTCMRLLALVVAIAMGVVLNENFDEKFYLTD